MTLTADSPSLAPTGAVRVNDCAIKLANVNGTGSASANSLLMQAIFRMGIPVSGKNLFPSNIQGLPTWYEIRVNKTGYTARALEYDLMVAMNGQTYKRDIQEVSSGGYVMYDSTWPLDEELMRPDVEFLGVPLAMMCNEHFNGARERILMKNIAYAGAIVAVLVDPDLVPGRQPLDVRREEVLSRDRNAHPEDRLHEETVRARRAGPVDVGELDGEVVDAAHLAAPAVRVASASPAYGI